MRPSRLLKARLRFWIRSHNGNDGMKEEEGFLWFILYEFCIYAYQIWITTKLTIISIYIDSEEIQFCIKVRLKLDFLLSRNYKIRDFFDGNISITLLSHRLKVVPFLSVAFLCRTQGYRRAPRLKTMALLFI